PDEQAAPSESNGNGEIANDEGNHYKDDRKKSRFIQGKPQMVEDLPLWLILGERRIGSFRRELHFPVEVDIEKLEAKLEAGLLRLNVPKKLHSYSQGSGKIHIATGDN
ncbi:hypothetical protein LTR95_019136, partial [Oleoguttula sp. CCFEE 5521]